MIKYYQETKTKDYLAVDTASRAYYKRIGKSSLEGRATCIDKLPSSMCTLSISTVYLKNGCKRVPLKDVPKNWLQWIGY